MRVGCYGAYIFLDIYKCLYLYEIKVRSYVNNKVILNIVVVDIRVLIFGFVLGVLVIKR